MSPEWIAVSLSGIVAALSGFQIWQGLNIKLAVSSLETNMETKFGTVREWARETFVSKTDQMHLLEIVSNRDQKQNHG